MAPTEPASPTHLVYVRYDLCVRDSPLPLTWCMCDMTSVCVTRLSHSPGVCAIWPLCAWLASPTHLVYVRYDLCVRGSPLPLTWCMCDMTSVCVTRLSHSPGVCAIWPLCAWLASPTHLVYVRYHLCVRDSPLPLTWCMCDMTSVCVTRLSLASPTHLVYVRYDLCVRGSPLPLTWCMCDITSVCVTRLSLTHLVYVRYDLCVRDSPLSHSPGVCAIWPLCAWLASPTHLVYVRYDLCVRGVLQRPPVHLQNLISDLQIGLVRRRACRGRRARHTAAEITRRSVKMILDVNMRSS